MFLQRQLKPEYAALPPALSRDRLDTDEHAIDVLARTLWGEARGEGLTGIEAVASVVLNRVAHAKTRRGFWWGDDIVSVCRKPYQFSCWNADDPNAARLPDLIATDRTFALCLRIARRALAGQVADATQGATHYHNGSVSPRWARDAVPTAVIGRHIFYRVTG